MQRTREEFENLFRDAHRPIFGFFYSLGISEEDAEDLTQKTFVEAYKAWKRYRGEASPKSWIFSIARNVLHNAFRDRSRLKRKSEEVSYDKLMEERSPALPRSDPTDVPSPLDAALLSERNKMIRAAVEELPEILREPTFLQLDQGLKYREIAEVLKEPEDLIKSRLYQARQKLKLSLERHFGPGGY